MVMVMCVQEGGACTVPGQQEVQAEGKAVLHGGGEYRIAVDMKTYLILPRWGLVAPHLKTPRRRPVNA